MANRFFRTKLNEPCAEQLALPFYGLLPKDPIGLLKWKLYVRERALEDLEFRKWFLQCCKEDVAFFAASVIWIHETRPVEGVPVGKFPFMPDCDQVDILAWLTKFAGSIDITIAKTRGIGLSYLLCIYTIWLWLFHGERLEFGLVTKDATSLDSKDRPSSLLGKLDLLFDILPAWMKVDDNGKMILKRTVSDNKFQNLRNGNIIGGYVAGDDKLRSGRFYFVARDEAAFFNSDEQRWAASAHGTTNSVIWLSTFNGTANTFYRISNDDNPIKNIVRIETWWDASPRWQAGKYVSKNGRIEILDAVYKFPSDYAFSHDEPGLERSPLVDSFFNRPGADRQLAKEEIYGVAVKDARKLFSCSRTQSVLAKSAERHVWRGDYEEGQWVEDESGPIKLWIKPDCFTGAYVAGCDPCQGVGQALAGFGVMDVKTGLCVLTARFDYLDQLSFAQKAVAICQAICGPRSAGMCTLAWESTGIGVSFTAEVLRLRYPAIWYDPGKSTVGCHNQDDGEGWLLEFGRAIREKDGIIKCSDLIEELNFFEYNRDGDLIYAGTAGHGDLAIACSLMWRAGAQRRKAIIEAQKRDRKTNEIELNEFKQKQRKQTYSDMFERRKRA